MNHQLRVPNPWILRPYLVEAVSFDYFPGIGKATLESACDETGDTPNRDDGTDAECKSSVRDYRSNLPQKNKDRNFRHGYGNDQKQARRIPGLSISITQD